MSVNKHSHKSELDHLKELILKSGFPLEIEICSFLLKRCILISEDVDIVTGAYYLDKDVGKGRELDIKVKIPIIGQKGEKSPMIFLNLLIQCKSIPGNAWIFFQPPHRITPICASTSILDAMEWIPRAHVDFTFQEGLHFKNIPITTTYNEYILDKNTSNKRDDNLFEAIISLAKATSYELETSVQGDRQLLERFSAKSLLEHPPNFAEIIYPTIVFDGKMYMVKNVEKGKEMDLLETNHVGLFLDYVSGSYDVELIIDIVHKKEFEKFFEKIITDIKILQEALRGEVGKKFTEEVLKALKWYLSKGTST